ncbi:endonuclease III domain-containing protein [Natronococcus occultus]|uniref:Putative endoIII-related endonuclease n=1 Tax=Natronococcus occultus SP4 TaxID=694430 RepID=L0K1X9_9EURY|nr:endonuclease III [Natronococcus occultus]AGB38565.1 putative endoIII-related endonuclease [Natronococcus occultus SP4]
MTDDREPAVNISGGDTGGGTAAEFDPATADTRAERVVDRLGELYWQKTYGGQDAFTCLIRTILSQNTSDKASQPAHDALIDRYDDPDRDLAAALADAEQSELAETISSAGLYNQKSEMIIGAAEEILAEFESAAGFDDFVREAAPEGVRERLLEIHGVGPKTADCVLLFAGGRGGVFPVDTHVHRIYRRLGVAPPDADHEDVRAVLEREVPAAKCGFGHTASIQFGREYCTARKPACLEDPDACPMGDVCDQVGVYPETDEVVDPSVAAD